MGREGGRIPPTQAGLWEMVVPDKKAWKLLGPLTFGSKVVGWGQQGVGVFMGEALASDISPGKVFEKFQTQKVSIPRPP